MTSAEFKIGVEKLHRRLKFKEGEAWDAELVAELFQRFRAYKDAAWTKAVAHLIDTRTFLPDQNVIREALEKVDPPRPRQKNTTGHQPDPLPEVTDRERMANGAFMSALALAMDSGPGAVDELNAVAQDYATATAEYCPCGGSGVLKFFAVPESQGRRFFAGPCGNPCAQPPFTRLTVIDENGNEIMPAAKWVQLAAATRAA